MNQDFIDFEMLKTYDPVGVDRLDPSNLAVPIDYVGAKINNEKNSFGVHNEIFAIRKNDPNTNLDCGEVAYYVIWDTQG